MEKILEKLSFGRYSQIKYRLVAALFYAILFLALAWVKDVEYQAGFAALIGCILFVPIYYKINLSKKHYTDFMAFMVGMFYCIVITLIPKEIEGVVTWYDYTPAAAIGECFIWFLVCKALQEQKIERTDFRTKYHVLLGAAITAVIALIFMIFIKWEVAIAIGILSGFAAGISKEVWDLYIKPKLTSYAANFSVLDMVYTFYGSTIISIILYGICFMATNN